MTRKEYEDLISQPDVIAEDLLDNLVEIILNERVIIPRISIVPKLKQTPIPQEVGMSVRYYKLGLSKHDADLLLDVIHDAQRTNDKKTAYKPERLLFLVQKWQRYCDCGSFG